MNIKSISIFKRILLLEYSLEQYKNYQPESISEEVERLKWNLKELKYFDGVNLNDLNDINLNQVNSVDLSLNLCETKTVKTQKIKQDIKIIKDINSIFKTTNLRQSILSLKKYINNLNEYFDCRLEDTYILTDLTIKILKEIDNEDIFVLLKYLNRNSREYLAFAFVKFMDTLSSKDNELITMLLKDGLINKEFIEQNTEIPFGNFNENHLIYMIRARIIDINIYREKITDSAFDLGNFKLLNWCFKNLNYTYDEIVKHIKKLFIESFDYCQRESNNALLELIKNKRFKIDKKIIGILSKYISDDAFGREYVLTESEQDLQSNVSEISLLLNDIEDFLEDMKDEMLIEELEEEELQVYISVLKEAKAYVNSMTHDIDVKEDNKMGTIYFDKQNFVDNATMLLIDKIQSDEDEKLVGKFYDNFKQDKTISQQKLIKILSKTLKSKDKNIMEI